MEKSVRRFVPEPYLNIVVSAIEMDNNEADVDKSRKLQLYDSKYFT